MKPQPHHRVRQKSNSEHRNEHKAEAAILSINLKSDVEDTKDEQTAGPESRTDMHRLLQNTDTQQPAHLAAVQVW